MPILSASLGPLPNTADVICFAFSFSRALPFLILNALFPLTNKAYGIFLFDFFIFKNLAHAPSRRFSKLSFEISTPNTNDSLELIHLGKSPALPQAKSTNVSPCFDVPVISLFLTYKLWKSFMPSVLNFPAGVL